MTKFDSGWSIFGSNSKQTLREMSEVENSHEGDHSGKIIVFFNTSLGFPGGSDSKESACSAGDRGSIPGSGTT